MHNIQAKVTFANDGYVGAKYLQRGVLADETGSIDFVIYRDADLHPLECEGVYEFRNIFAWDNRGFLTVRPNKREHGCIVTKIDKNIGVNHSRIFRERQRIPSILKSEICKTCSMLFDRIIYERSQQIVLIDDQTKDLAARHVYLQTLYFKGEPISYGAEINQDAYMYGFFPYYIGMIYHILRSTEFENSSEIFKNDMTICFYGCGPAPELLGFAGYLRDYHPDVQRINVVFFDNTIWDTWRNYVLTDLLPLYWNGKVHASSFDFDILQFSEKTGKDITDTISSAAIHSIQNVLSDLNKSPETLKKMEPPFFELYKKTASDSIMIFSDQYYEKTARILDQISSNVKEHNLGTIVTKPDTPQQYQREFDTPFPMRIINHHYKNFMGFYYMVLKRI